MTWRPGEAQGARRAYREARVGLGPPPAPRSRPPNPARPIPRPAGRKRRLGRRPAAIVNGAGGSLSSTGTVALATDWPPSCLRNFAGRGRQRLPPAGAANPFRRAAKSGSPQIRLHVYILRGRLNPLVIPV